MFEQNIFGHTGGDSEGQALRLEIKRATGDYISPCVQSEFRVAVAWLKAAWELKMFSKNLASLFAITGLLLSGLASAQGIAGSAHDFSGDTWSGGEICIVCHAAHDADLSVAAEAPLWNHEITTSTFLEYSSGTLDGTVTNDLNTTSKLCLSCHDGTVALDSFGGATGTDFMTGGALLSTDLTNDHPVSIDYNVTDTGLFPVGNASGLGSTIDSDLLFGGNVECASCHDVHDTAGNADLLRKDNAGSALCLTCHNK